MECQVLWPHGTSPDHSLLLVQLKPIGKMAKSDFMFSECSPKNVDHLHQKLHGKRPLNCDLVLMCFHFKC